jgi:O-antigen ligase
VDALLISVFGIIQAYGITYYIGMDTVGTVLRGPSFTGNADYTGIFLSAAIPFNFFLLYVEKSKKLKYFWAVILFINIFGLVMAGSRAALVAVSFELGILLIVGLIKFRKKIIVVSALSIAVMAALCALFLPVYRNGISDSSSVNARLIVWNDAVLSIIKHPVLGIGLGQVVFTIPGDVHNYFDDVHNLFLQIGVTGGLPSLACLIAVLGYVFYIDWRMVLSKYTDDDAKNLIICLLIAELGFVIAVCFSPVPSSAWIVLSVLIASQTAVISQGNSWQEHSWLKVESYRWFYYVLGTFLFLYALAFLVGEVALYQGMYSTVDGPANQKQSMFYENLSRHIYPDEFMSSYDYIRQFIYLNKNNSDESRRKIAEYAKLYASAPAARWQLSDLYDQLYSQTHADEDLKSLIYYRTDELKSNPGVANVALSLATVYNGNGELEKANQVIHDTLEEPGLDNPQTLWIFLAKIENEEDKSPSTVIADLRAAYLSDTTNLQLKHLLEQSKKDPSVAIKYVLGGH